MEVFNIKNNKVEIVELNPFKLEKDIQGVIEKNDYASKPVIPINKKGGSGGEAMTYVKKKNGDVHTLMITLNNVLT